MTKAEIEAWAEHAHSGGRFAGGDYPDGDVMHIRHVESGREWCAFLRTDWSPTWLVDGMFEAPSGAKEA